MAKDVISQMEDIMALLKLVLTKNKKQKDFEPIETQFQNIKNRETNILICGEFKRGKSSFINAFLEQDICPVDTNIATAAVSIIRYGEKVKITRRYGDLSDLKSEELTSLDQIAQYVTGSADSISNTVLLEIEIPNLKLKSGIALIDTPGVGGLDPRHEILTKYFLPKADISLFVVDKDSPMSAKEIEFVKTYVLPKARNNAILVAKADLFSTEQEKEEWIADILQNRCPGVQTVIPISSKAKLDFLKTRDAESLTESNFENVENEIERLTIELKKEHLVKLKKIILNLLNEIHVPLTTQIKQIKTPDPELIKRLEDEAAIYEEQKSKLTDSNSEYRINLNQIINQARNSVELKLQEESILLSSTELQKMVNSEQARLNQQWLLEQINNAICSLATELDMMIDAAFDQVLFIVGAEKENLAAHSQFNYEIEVNLTPLQKSLGSKACDAAKQALPGVGLGSLVMFAAGAVLSGGTSLLLGGLATVLFIGKNVKDAAQRGDASHFATQLNPQIQIAIRHLNSYIVSRFADFNQGLLTMLQKGIQRAIENQKNVINSLTKLKAETMQSQQLKSKLLIEELKPLEDMIKKVEIYLSNPFEK